jgi:hypothetical protein
LHERGLSTDALLRFTISWLYKADMEDTAVEWIVLMLAGTPYMIQPTASALRRL